jgi:hypothetical protein
MPAPIVAVGLAHSAWAEIGASDWLICQLRFGLQLPWRRMPTRSAQIPSYNLSPADQGFACGEVKRWMTAGFCRRASDADLIAIRQRGRVSSAFVTTTAAKPRLVIDYTVVNECMETRNFRMDQLSDLAPTLLREDCMFKADIQDAYYHLRLRKSDQRYLAFSVGGVVCMPCCLNCHLAVAPWFFTKAMRPVVAYLRAKGHRVFSYLDEFFRGRSDCAQRLSGDRGLYGASRDGYSFSVRAPRPHPAPEHVRLRRDPVAGDPRDRDRYTPRAVSSLPRKAPQGRECRSALAGARARSQEACPGTDFAEFSRGSAIRLGWQLWMRGYDCANCSMSWLWLAGCGEISELGASAEESIDGAPSRNSDISPQPARVTVR